MPVQAVSGGGQGVAGVVEAVLEGEAVVPTLWARTQKISKTQLLTAEHEHKLATLEPSACKRSPATAAPFT
ncbi:hypothetical protein J6590_069122 [Homalodisca vitripennis]|nr:hypothetical protein J6590_069122 [Homalodisca vitripennis]